MNFLGSWMSWAVYCWSKYNVSFRVSRETEDPFAEHKLMWCNTHFLLQNEYTCISLFEQGRATGPMILYITVANISCVGIRIPMQQLICYFSMVTNHLSHSSVPHMVCFAHFSLWSVGTRLQGLCLNFTYPVWHSGPHETASIETVVEYVMSSLHGWQRLI